VTEHKTPKEGDVKSEGGKAFVWTKRVEGDCSIYEWVEQKPVYTFVPTDYMPFG
jgi:hypothetical protein